ncbi:hypothetical protein [Eubacterium sp.]|uniref:hypothetical protein n=1 Tax=Eubacterium sp. TaxID=142586 RepID=UPI0025EF6F53|nr:hypothetical protein [Eubacterium sp.]MCR5629945.1 hypothetical protein [Eubacterium sp.]
MIKISVGTQSKIKTMKLENKIHMYMGIIKKNEIPRKLTLWHGITQYNESVWYTDYAWFGERNRRKKIRYSKDEFSDVVTLEFKSNGLYFGPDAIKNYDIDYEKGNTINVLARTIAIMILQFEEYKSRKFAILIDLLNDTKIDDEEPEFYMYFMEVREECYESYRHFSDESMINILVET